VNKSIHAHSPATKQAGRFLGRRESPTGMKALRDEDKVIKSALVLASLRQ
jgi:hypothetical protein